MGSVLTVLQSKRVSHLKHQKRKFRAESGLQRSPPTKRDRPAARENHDRHGEAFKKSIYLPKHWKVLSDGG